MYDTNNTFKADSEKESRDEDQGKIRRIAETD